MPTFLFPPQQPPTTNTPTPPLSMMPTATTTTTVTVVVLHKPRHHQTADMARQRACHVEGDSQDAERDTAAPDFVDHATKERGKGGKGQQEARGTKASPPQGQVRRSTPIPLPKGPTTRDDDNTALHQWERPRTLKAPPIHKTLTAHIRRRPPPKNNNRPRRMSTHGQWRPLPPLMEDDDPLHGWTTSPTPWTDSNHPRTTIPNHHHPHQRHHMDDPHL
ncbi:hypothetical protein K443DRAFT_14853 [Laccaria amethystina LaAM-08-1]|uniref:Uncharacterized protein n=1 Tax=Laccaria amethystina LaAM-08-1 TaxID=1095629 RepID=A0A0C9X006_9AGAR|nr:hypothetical protein K443DRAFT_14853 [Laccaria amethystina LaAM-08-1]